jgi:hypothetical protein
MESDPAFEVLDKQFYDFYPKKTFNGPYFTGFPVLALQYAHIRLDIQMEDKEELKDLK